MPHVSRACWPIMLVATGLYVAVMILDGDITYSYEAAGSVSKQLTGVGNYLQPGLVPVLFLIYLISRELPELAYTLSALHFGVAFYFAFGAVLMFGLVTDDQSSGLLVLAGLCINIGISILMAGVWMRLVLGVPVFVSRLL